jgi:beta-lactamase regulating signal transducer with metallopeptidase domain
MVYCAVVSALLGLAALSLQHALNRRGLPLRGVWMIAIIGSLALSAAPWFRSTPALPVASAGLDASDVAVAADRTWRRAVSSEIASVLPLRGVRDATSLEPGISALQAFDRFLLFGWVLTSSSVLVLLLGAHRRLGRRRRRWRADVIDGVPVLVSKDVGPAVVGFVHTAIVVPEWVAEFDAERRRLVLAHETEHLRAADPALLLAAFAFVAVMPWNAPLWWQVRRLRHAVELDCDTRVLQGTHDAAAYGELLVDVGEQVSIRRLGLAAFAESSTFLAARIRNLTAPRPRAWRTLAGVTIAAGALLLAVACEAPTPIVTAESAARAQDDRLGLGPEASALIAAVESEGAAHPRPEQVRPYAPHPRTGLELLGGPERRCVLVPDVDESQPKVIRSGEFVILGRLSELEEGRRFRLSWAPLADASMEMELDARTWKVDAADERAIIEVGYVTAPMDSHTLEYYADEAWFLGGAQFPSAGTWVVVGRTGRSWGCFVFSVPERG